MRISLASARAARFAASLASASLAMLLKASSSAENRSFTGVLFLPEPGVPILSSKQSLNNEMWLHCFQPCVRARAVAAGAAGKGRSAARRPGACRSEGRGARKVDSMPGPRPGGPGRTRRLPAPTAGQSVTPVSPRRRGWDSGNRPPGGAAARAAGGGGGGGAGPQGRRPAHPEVLVVAAARAARRAWPPAADCVPPEEKRPGTPRRVEARAASWGGSSRPAGPTPPLRPQDGGRECELMRVPVGGYPCLGHLKLSGLEGLGEWAGAAVLTVGT